MSEEINPVKGTKDFYPESMALRSWFYSKVKKVSSLYGYQEYEGPLLEPIELYAAKSGEELVKQQAFVFPDKGGNLITLRPELTPTLARMVAKQQNSLTFPLRWWSYGPMWRYERPQRGRTREFFQWNIDLIGLESPEADAELVAIAATFLKEIGLCGTEVKVFFNNRRLMESEILKIGIHEEKISDVIRLIDRSTKLSAHKWESFATEIGLTPNQINLLKNLLLNSALWQNSDELIRFYEVITSYGLEDYVQFDPRIVRGLDYYTGTVFEAFDVKRKFRAVLGGGRYDNLVNDVGGTPISGVGFAMGDKVIEVVLDSLGKLPDTSKIISPPILFTLFSEEMRITTNEVATDLRNAGINIATYPSPEKLGKQFRYADKLGCNFVIILGPDEVKRNVVTVKDLTKRTQEEIPLNELVGNIQKSLETTAAS